MSADKEAAEGRVRLMQQVRAGAGFRYFFMSRGVKLTIGISPRANEGDPSDWRVDVKAGKDPDELAISEWAATKGEALSLAGVSWATASASHPFPDFDWTAVTEALRTVRAI